jgi:phage terminase large subunit GpA-like protein
MKEFPGGHLVLAGANSAAELKSSPIRYLFEDEIDEYPDDLDGQGPADKLAEKRTTTFRGRRKIYRCSSPTKAGKSKIWAHWLRSDQRRFYVPCPHCQHEQVLIWAQFRWEVKKVWEIVDAEGVVHEVAPGAPGAVGRDTDNVTAVWYECEHCEKRIEEHHKTRMLLSGRWLRENPDSPRAGFHLPSYYSPLGWFSWREVVEERLEADRDPTEQLLKVWMNTVAGEPFTARADTVGHDEVSKRGEDYSLGTVPAGGLMLTAFVDVQADRLELVVKAWGQGEESWLVDYQIIFGDSEATRTWDELDVYLQRQFAHESGALLGISAVGIDSGFQTQTVYSFCRTRGHRMIVPTKGRSEPGRAILGRPSAQDVKEDGKVLPEAVKLWPLGVDTAKQKIYARLKIEKPGPGYMHFPLGLPLEYYKGLTAERQTHKYVRGYLRLSWEKHATERNEPLDCEVGAYAMAILAGIARMDWPKQKAELEARAAAQLGRLQAENAQLSAPVAQPVITRPAYRRGNWINRWRH